jgi:hypothetical protein
MKRRDGGQTLAGKQATMKKDSYRSGLERSIAKELKQKKVPFKYEPPTGKISYVIPSSNHKYTPDFYITSKSGKVIIIEAKGIWDYTDRLKHLLIRQQHPELDIRFVFSNPKSKIRKGSKITYADICDGKGRAPFKDVKWQYAKKSIPIGWIKE